MKLESGAIVSNRYVIDDVLGRGGMAVVYRALDQKLGRYVTLKVLRDEYANDEDYVRRFPGEAQAAAALNHPNIAQVYDSGQDGPVCYIVLEYIDGTNLKTLINRKAPFDNETTIAVAIQIADGLGEAHSYGIVHRDVKPQNILVTPTSTVKVTDFGIARAAQASTLTQGAESMGSVHYFSPEQARRGYVDNKSDIYALGITMYEMATGMLPFDGDSIVNIAMQHINDPLPDMLHANPNISEALERVILKATEKSPAKRYQSMEEMTADLRRAFSDVAADFAAPNAAYDTGPLSGNTAPYDEYYDEQDDYEEEPPANKEDDRKIILFGLLLALPFVLVITLLSFGIYRWLRNDWVDIIDLTGKSAYAAREWTDAQGLQLYLMDAYSDEHPVGYVFNQRQTPDFDGLRPGDTIHVYVSLGVEPLFDMPNVTNFTYEDARAMLDAIDVRIPFYILTEELAVTDLPVGMVMNQYPEYGAVLRSGDLIRLQVSVWMEDAYIEVPILVGRGHHEAVTLLEATGFIVGMPEQEAFQHFAAGLVGNHNYEAGDMVPRNTVIILVISTGPPDVPTPTPDPTPTPSPDPDPTPTPTPTPSPDPTPTPPPGDPESTPEPTPTPPPEEPPAARTGSIAIALPPLIAARDEPHHMAMFIVIGSDDPVIIFNHPEISAALFPMTFTAAQLNSLANMPRPLQGDGEEIILIQFLDENNVPIWWTDQVFHFDD